MNGFLRALKRHARWAGWIAIVFLAHVGVVTWFGDDSLPPARKPAPAPLLTIAGPGTSGLLALSDPTLFVLPHYRGFSGNAWLKPPPNPSHSFEWTEEPRWLGLSTQDFPRLDGDGGVQTGKLNAFEVVAGADVEPSALKLSVPAQFRQKSSIKIDGAIADRKLVRPPTLPSWASTNLLTNTVVRIIVNREGLPRSEAILVRSGLKEADDYAIKTTRSLRFEPETSSTTSVRGSSVADADMTWGIIVYQWHGVGANGGAK